MYDQGQYHTAMTRLDRMISEYGQTIEIAEAYYVRGLCRLKTQQTNMAASDFTEAIKRSKRSDLTARARASLAAIAYQQGQWTRAADLYAQALADLPDDEPKDRILYCAGLSLQRAGRWKESRFAFGEIRHKFRQSAVADEAMRISGWEHDYFTIQLGAFSDADKAAVAVKGYRTQGLDATQEYLPRGSRNLWVVMAGRYADYEAAENALRQVRRQHPDAFIIP